MTTNRIVVIGASAGGIEALRVLVGGLPADFPAPIGVVLHTASRAPAILEEILSRAGRLVVTNARSGERLLASHIYVAPPDRHLIVEPGVMRVTRGPRENRFRPAIDPLFRSAAQVYGPGAVGVILTGNLDDGAAGLCAIRQLGGIAVVQDPADALYPAMPENAARAAHVETVTPLAAIAPLLTRLVNRPLYQRDDVVVG